MPTVRPKIVIFYRYAKFMTLGLELWEEVKVSQTGSPLLPSGRSDTPVMWTHRPYQMVPIGGLNNYPLYFQHREAATRES